MPRPDAVPVSIADASLAARIDRAEAALCAACARSLGGARPVRVDAIAGGFAVYAKPGSPVNKIAGLGFDEDLDEGRLEEIETRWREAGEAVRVELATLARPSIGAMLTARGYRLIGFEDVLGLALERVPAGAAGAPVPGLTIEPLSPGDVAVWTDVAVTGFLHLDGSGTGPPDTYSREALEEVVSDFVRTPGFERFLARIDGAPAAAASLRLDGGLAQLAGAATLPPFRRRGIQAALLAARLQYAREAGCDLAVVTTAPGSKSQANARRQGFQQLYTRAVLVRSWE